MHELKHIKHSEKNFDKEQTVDTQSNSLDCSNIPEQQNNLTGNIPQCKTLDSLSLSLTLLWRTPVITVNLQPCC